VLVELLDVGLQALDPRDEALDGEAEDDDDVLSDNPGAVVGDELVHPLGVGIGGVVVAGGEVAEDAEGEHAEELLQIKLLHVVGDHSLIDHNRSLLNHVIHVLLNPAPYEKLAQTSPVLPVLVPIGLKSKHSTRANTSKHNSTRLNTSKHNST